jgi:hypothetical protein
MTVPLTHFTVNVEVDFVFALQLWMVVRRSGFQLDGDESMVIMEVDSGVDTAK